MGVRGTGSHLVAAVKWLGGDVRACAFASCRAHQRQELFRGGLLGGAARAKLHAQVHRVQTHLKHSTTTMCRRRYTYVPKGFVRRLRDAQHINVRQVQSCRDRLTTATVRPAAMAAPATHTTQSKRLTQSWRARAWVWALLLKSSRTRKGGGIKY
jgi:hypothetical protein